MIKKENDDKKILNKKNHAHIDDNKKKSKKKNKELNSYEQLLNFMNNHRNNAKGEMTHTMCYSPGGAYSIPDSEYGLFRKYYTAAIIDGYPLHIVERHKDVGPIIIDLDFKYPKDNPNRQYTINTIHNIVKIYNDIITDCLEVNTENLIAYVSEKKAPTLRGEYFCDGIHIVYPHICTIPGLQFIIRQKFIDIVTNFHNIFKKMNLSNNLDDIVDKSVIYRNGWLMYGSTKNPHSNIYRLTHIFTTSKYSYNNKLIDTMLIGEDINTPSIIKRLVDLLSCRRFNDKSDLTRVLIDTKILDDKIADIEQKLTLNNQKIKLSDYVGPNTKFTKITSPAEYIDAKNLVKLLSANRATEYSTWYQIGKCLSNIDYRLLEDWIEFSKTSLRKNFNEENCRSEWQKMKPSNYSLSTLHFFALSDNPDEYAKFKKEKIHHLIKEGLDGSHYSFARLLKEKYGYIYRCASIKNNLWYEFKNHKWLSIDSGYTIHEKISLDIHKEYTDYQSYLYGLARNENLTTYERTQFLKEADQISKIIPKLRNNTFKGGVIKEFSYLSYDADFLKNIDENLYLICFENGVYDLELDVFRDGCPDDYLTLSVGYNYTKYDENDENIKEINDFICKIQPVQEMREYLLMVLSTCIAGSISEESFYVWTGSGANGKSKLMELVKYTLGDLFKPMDILLIVGKRTSSSSATPELADKKGIRLCPFDEPNSDDEINTGFMKIFTGGDLISARALYSDPIYFKPQFKPFLLCNILPKIRSDDDGTWRRLKVIPFLSKFVLQFERHKYLDKNGNLLENHFDADDSISEKLKDWRESFMSILINYYRKYRKNRGLTHPKLVTKETELYRKRCDIFQDFITDYLEFTENPSDSISIMQLHDAMRNWYRSNHEGRCPGAKDLRDYMQKKIKSFHLLSDSLKGYRVKNTTEDTVDELFKMDDDY